MYVLTVNVHTILFGLYIIYGICCDLGLSESPQFAEHPETSLYIWG